MNIIFKSILFIGLLISCYYGYTYFFSNDATSQNQAQAEMPIVTEMQPTQPEPEITVSETIIAENPITTLTEEISMKKITTPSGLAYEVITAAPAEATSPQQGQVVSVHYTGWLDDNGNPGNKFDSSVDRGEQFQFPLGMGYVIQGWDQAVADMKIGEKRRVYIPAELGYGAHGAGAAILPYANLIFDIELFGAQ